MPSLWSDIYLSGTGTVQVYDYELEQLRSIADVHILATEDVSGHTGATHRYTVRYVVKHPATHIRLPSFETTRHTNGGAHMLPPSA
jgi:hypothetical protein